CFFLIVLLASRYILSFPTRRSSDLAIDCSMSSVAVVSPARNAAAASVSVGSAGAGIVVVMVVLVLGVELWRDVPEGWCSAGPLRDRKRTRLNSSHVENADAVCLQKK